MKANNKQITYPAEEKEDFFTKLINFLRRLELFTKQNRKVCNYFLAGTLLIILGIMVGITNC